MRTTNQSDDQAGKTQEAQGPQKPKHEGPLKWVAVAAFFTLVFLTVTAITGGSTPKNATIGEATAAIDDGQVTKATMNDTTRVLQLELQDGSKMTTGYPHEYGTVIVDKLGAKDVPVTVNNDAGGSVFESLILQLLPLMLIFGAMFFLMRKSGIGNFGKMGRNLTEAVPVPDTHFADVGGVDEAVEDLSEVVDFLKDPERFERLGARVPRGVLLVGPPGTGKTLLARATAGEAGVPFFALSGSDFVEMFVGVGASRVRSAFENARKAGRAIVFIDEIDAIGKTRGGGAISGANDERENTLNALLVEMDGFSNSGVVVIGATNRPDVLDSAMVRPGRFDRRVLVAAPDRKGRRQLFSMYLNKASLEQGVDAGELAERLAARSMGMTGADVAAVVNEAALSAARDGATGVDASHCMDALERIALGRERRSAEMSERGQRITAWHEAGHTVCGLMVPGAHKPERVSIVPRGIAGGATWFSGDDEHFVTRSQAFAELVVALGGRAAEEVLLNGDVTQGAQGDLVQATKRAEHMVCDWGMAGTLAHVDRERLFGESDAAVRAKVEEMLGQALATARIVMSDNAVLLAAIAEALLESETLDVVDLEAIMGRLGVIGARNRLAEDQDDDLAEVREDNPI